MIGINEGRTYLDISLEKLKTDVFSCLCICNNV